MREPGSWIRRFVVYALLLLFAGGSASAFGQSRVQGTVTDSQGNPLAGVNVVVLGTSVGTTTLSNGAYSLDLPAGAQSLRFSFIGMKTQDVNLNSRSLIDVRLEEDAARMDEVVIVGYGTQKKVHLTGAVAAVADKEIKKSTVSTISQALVGKLPGLITQQATGAPGADGVTMMVRGTSSYNGSSPLVLVDGVERNMSTVDPNDVESVTILKDASASAVYGMKAAAGVILITTKRGHEGGVEINYRGSVTMSEMTTMPDFMNGTQYMDYYNMGLALDKQGGDDVPEFQFTPEEIELTHNGDPSDGYENTDWMSPMRRLTLMHQHNLSIGGGSNKVRYFVSGGFRNQNGIIKGHEDSRGNLRSNIDLTPHQNLHVALNVAGSVQDNYCPGGYSYENQAGLNLFHQMMYSIPFVPKWLEKDGERRPVSGYRAAWSAANPEYGSQHSGFSKSRNLRFETSANVEYSLPFVKGLKLGLFTSWDYLHYTGRSFSYAYDVLAYTFQRGSNIGADPLSKYSLVKAADLTADGNLYLENRNEQRVVLRPQISYSNTFGKHTVGALFLYEQTTLKNEKMVGGRRKFPVFDIAELNFGDPASATNGSASGESAYAGYVGRINYAYADKYLFEASFRCDGSYLFHEDQRWGFFPSVSVGWVLSQENFFQTAFPKIEYFKLRGSVGTLGNDNVAEFLYRKQFQYNTSDVAFGKIPTSQGTLSNQVAFPYEDLTWERTRTYDIGFELSAWNGMLGVEFDYFYKYTFNILQSIGGIYPPSLGGHYPAYINDGSFDNRGFELVLRHRHHIGQFNYNISGNLSFARNRILSKQQPDNTLPWKNILGSPVGAIWGLKSDGLYQSEEELANAPKPIGVQPRLGDIKYVDINGDGTITSDDCVRISRGRVPEMMFSFSFDAEYKGLDLSIQLQGAALCDRMIQATWNNGVADQTPLTIPWYANYDNAPLYLVENAWRPDKPHAEYPRLSVTKSSSVNNGHVSDFWKRNGAYLRLKNIVVGYTLPKHWLRKVGIRNLRVYFSGNNLLTATDFKWIDPESVNVPTGYYPQQRTYTFGVDLSF